MKEKRTDIQELGEFGLIRHITASFTPHSDATRLGVGDDGALVEETKGLTVLTSDMLLEGIHFDLSFMPLKHLGYKAVAVNVSDIAAMNGRPTHILVNLALSNRFSVEAVDELYEGIRMACKSYNVDLVGGDTCASRSGLVISVTAYGKVDHHKEVKRSGAEDGHILCVTGDLGAAYIGLQVLEREKEVFLVNPEMQPQLSKYEYLVQRQLRPEARMDIIHELDEKGIIPTAMIDISDGLASEIFHLSDSSGVGFRIFEENLPVAKETYDTAYEFKLDATTCVLNGGEDYELLFTITPEDHEKLKDHADIHFIGHAQAIEKGNNMVSKGENLVPLKAQGWNHMSK